MSRVELPTAHYRGTAMHAALISMLADEWFYHYHTMQTIAYTWTRAVTLQILSCLVVLWTSLPTAASASQPVAGCTGCGTTEISCIDANLTSFPQLPVSVQEMVEKL